MAVIDPTVGAFDHPSARLDDQPGFRVSAPTRHELSSWQWRRRQRWSRCSPCPPKCARGLARSVWPCAAAWGRRSDPADRLGVTTAATRIPAESTSTRLFTPSAFFAPSNPRGPATGDALTEAESTTARGGSSSSTRPDVDLTTDRGQDADPDPGAAPAQEMFVRRRPAHAEVMGLGVPPACGECRQAHPVGSR